MSLMQASHFTCDRCKQLDIVPLDGSGPPPQRITGPNGWLMFRLGADASVPPSHLCPDCATAFANFMATKVS